MDEATEQLWAEFEREALGGYAAPLSPGGLTTRDLALRNLHERLREVERRLDAEADYESFGMPHPEAP